MRLIQKPPAQYGNIPGIQTSTIREFQGVNTYDPFSIPDSFFMDISNLTMDDYPALSVRPGYTALGGAIGGRVLGLGVWKDQEIHAVFGDGTWRKWNGSAWQTLVSGLNASAPWSFTNFQGNLDDVHLFGANGINPMKKYGGSTVTNVATAPEGANYVTLYENRLWCAYGKTIHASALDRPEVWNEFGEPIDDGSYYKEVEADMGENINMLNGGLKKLTIGMPNSLHELYGGMPSEFQTIAKAKDIGAINNRSAIVQEGLMRFIHPTGIYDFSGGLQPDKAFSDVVRGYFGSVADTAAGSDSKKLYFYVAPNLLVYDPRVEAWTVWKNIDATCFAIMKNELYIGTRQGRVIKLGGDTDAGIPISWYAVTKPFTNQSMAQKLRWYKLWVVVDLPSGSTMKVSLSKTHNGNDWQEVMSLNGQNMNRRKVMIPVSKFANEDTIRIRFEGTGKAKIHEYTRQQRALPLS